MNIFKKAIVLASVAAVISNISLFNVSANIEYYNPSENTDEFFVCSSDDVIKIVEGEKETFFFADQMGRQILVLKEMPETTSELVDLIKAANANIHYCYIEDVDKIIQYDYNSGTISDTDHKMEIKYIIDTDKMTISDAVTNETLQDLSKKTEYWAITRNSDGKLRKNKLIYIGHQLSEHSQFISPVEAETMYIGDVDMNGTVDVTDISRLSLALLGDTSLTSDQLWVSDLDNDRVITLADLARLQQYLSKKIDTLG